MGVVNYITPTYNSMSVTGVPRVYMRAATKGESEARVEEDYALCSNPRFLERACSHCDKSTEEESCIRVCRSVVYHKQCLLEQHPREQEIMVSCSECGAVQTVQPVLSKERLLFCFRAFVGCFLLVQLVVCSSVTPPDQLGPLLALYLLTGMALMLTSFSVCRKLRENAMRRMMLRTLDASGILLWLLALTLLQAAGEWRRLSLLNSLYLAAFGLYYGSLLLYALPAAFFHWLITSVHLERVNSKEPTIPPLAWNYSPVCRICHTIGFRSSRLCKHVAVHWWCVQTVPPKEDRPECCPYCRNRGRPSCWHLAKQPYHLIRRETEAGQQLSCSECGAEALVQEELTYWGGLLLLCILSWLASLYFLGFFVCYLLALGESVSLSATVGCVLAASLMWAEFVWSRRVPELIPAGYWRATDFLLLLSVSFLLPFAVFLDVNWQLFQPPQLFLCAVVLLHVVRGGHFAGQQLLHHGRLFLYTTAPVPTPV